MPTKPDDGTIFMSVLKLSGSTIRKPIHRTVLARIGRKNFSVACVVLRSATTSPAQEPSWREDNRRASNGDRVNRIAKLALKRGKSFDLLAIGVSD